MTMPGRLPVALHVRAAVASLAHRKLRSLLTMLGMVFGVAAVVAMLAIGEGARRQTLAALDGMGTDVVTVESRRPTTTAAANQGGASSWMQTYGLTAADADRLARLVPGVQDCVVARIIRQNVAVQGRRLDARIIATTPGYARVVRLRLDRGRHLAPIDLEARSPVAVLGAGIARDLVPAADPLGASIRLGRRWFTVVGVLAPGQTQGERTILIPETTARSQYGITQITPEAGGVQVTSCEYDAIHLRLAAPESGASDPIAAGAVARTILHRPTARDDVAVVVPLDLIASQQRTQRIFTVVMASIASISLLVGGIGIMNIMLATVLERTREIGIRRAVGARRRDIRDQFLVEALVLTLSGGVAGAVLGVAGAEVIAVLAGWPVAVTWWSLLLAGSICTVVGVACGLYPAIAASRLAPVEALRSV
jgi:putative ABC transport system permease protein